MEEETDFDYRGTFRLCLIPHDNLQREIRCRKEGNEKRRKENRGEKRLFESRSANKIRSPGGGEVGG